MPGVLKREIELVLFDLDGTLFEFHHEYLYDQTHEIMARLDVPSVGRGELENCFTDFDFFRFVDQSSRDEFQKTFWEMFDWKNMPQATLIPGVLELLRALQGADVKMGIVTSRLDPHDALVHELSRTAIMEFMSFVKTRDGEHVHWMDKRSSIEQVCREAKVSPSKVAMVGDVPPDITSAQDVGVVMTVGVLSGGLKKEVLVRACPDVLFDSVAELLESEFFP